MIRIFTPKICRSIYFQIISLLTLVGIIHFEADAQVTVTFPQLPEPIVVCESESLLTFRVQVETGGEGLSSVDINLPLGISYVLGSLTITDNSGFTLTEGTIVDLNEPSFVISGSPSMGDYVEATILKTGDCEASSNASMGTTYFDSLLVDFTTGSFDTTSSNYNVLYGDLFLQYESPANTSVSSRPTDTCRDIRITNGGNGYLTRLTHRVIPQPGLQSYTLSFNGTDLTPSVTSGDTLWYELDLSQAPFAGLIGEGGIYGMDTLENGEALLLEECFTIECDISGGLSVDHRSNWGCDGATCDPSNTITGTVSAPSVAPNLGLEITTDNHEICFDGSDEGILRVRLTNNGSENALINQVRYNSGGNGSAITSVQFFQNTMAFALGDVFSDEDSNSGSGCGGGTSQSTFSNDPMEMSHLSLDPGDSIILEMRYVRCCPTDECGPFSLSRPSIRVWALNECGENSRNWTGNGGIDGSASVSAPIVSGPAEILDGESETICVTFPSHSFLDLFDEVDQNVIFNVSLPDGLTYDNASMVASYNGMPFAGAMLPVETDDQVTVAIPLSEIDMAGSHPLEFCFDVTASCPGVGGDIEYSIGQTLDLDCDPACAVNLRCETYEVVIPGCDCDEGGTFYSTDVQRVSFGYEDTNDDRNWESFTRADSSDVDLTRVIVGDTVRNRSSIGLMGSGSWDQVLYTEAFPNDAVWCFDTAWVVVKDNMGNSVNIGNIIPSSSTGGDFEYDLSPDALGITGAYATAYDNADTLLFRAEYIFCKEENEDWYSLDGATESNNIYEDILVRHSLETTAVGGMESQECGFDANRLTLLGTALSVDFVSNDATGSGCDRNFRYRIDVRQNIGGISSGSGANFDFFPNEFRPLYFPDSIAIRMQPNINYDTAWLRVQQWTDGGTTTMTQGLVPTMIVDSVIYYDIEAIHDAFGGDFSFEEENATVQYYIEFMRTCGSNSQLMTDLSISYRTPLCPDSLFIQRDETAQAGGGANLGNISFNPSSSAVIEAANEISCFDLRVRPQGGNLAYTWLEILNPEDIEIVSVSEGGVPLILENGIYPTGIHNNNDQKVFEICANLTTCSETEVQVVFGWDCYGYPSDAEHEEACSYDTITYILRPIESTIMLELTEQPAVGPVDYPDLCDDLLYELRINSSGAGDIIDPSITASLPVGFVIDYVEVEYMGNTEIISHTTLGSSIIANFYDHPDLEHDSLPGLLTTTDVPNRQALMRFYGSTDCDFRSGSRLRFELSADRPCSGPATGDGSTVETERLRLEGLNPYITDPVLFSGLEGALSCGKTTTIGVSFEVADGDFIGQDSAVILLPPGVNFVEGSIYCEDPMLCPVFARVEEDGSGGSMVYLWYPSGQEGTTVEYSFDIVLDNSFECGSSVEVGLENLTIVEGELDCGATVCDGPHTVITGGNSVIYQVENTELMFTSFTAVNPIGTNEVLYQGELEVSEVAVSALDTFRVEFYCADATGDPVGPSLGSSVFSGPAEIGETIAFNGTVPGDCPSGEIIGVVSAVNNCICAEVRTNTDIEQIEPVFDLALLKEVENSGPYRPGDTAVFNITLYNQGNVSADSVTIQDYLPAGELEYLAIGDSVKNSSSGFPVTITDLGAGAYGVDSLVAGDTLQFNISLRVNADFMGTSIRNWAEISYATNVLDEPDSDSSPDDENFNQPGETDDLDDDNIVDEDGMDGGDEDDHDPAEIEVEQIFDLALKKELARDPLMVFPGAEIDFTITLYNQNGLSADSIRIMDYLMMDSLHYTSTGNQILSSANGISTQVIDYGDGTYGIDTLAAYDTLEFDITLLVDELFLGDSITNYAEITYASNVLDIDDIDSDPDGNRYNDSGGQPESDADNFVEGDGSGDPGDGNPETDEDDHDPAKFEVLKTFDLALKKIIKPGTLPVDGFTWGDTIHFEVTIFNQGFISADSIVIQDYVPLDPNMPGSTDSVLQQIGDLSVSLMSSANSTPIELIDNGDGTFSLDTLPLLDSVTFDVSYRINENFRGLNAINNAEIILGSNVPGLEDEDSTPGDNEMSEAELSTDNDVDDDGPGTPGTEDNPDDSDDYDPAEFNMNPRFDLALSKVIADTLSPPLNYGDTIIFGINVINEGNVTASSFEVTDLIPSGFAYISSNDTEGWTFDGTSMASRTVTDSLKAYDDTTILIELVLVQDFEPDAYVNTAEITYDENDLDEDDEDSTPDNDDPEEDDIEQRQVNVADLALRKVLSSTTPGPFGYGDTLAMEIEVYNQGNVPVDSIEITDYLPAGLTYIDDVSLNPGWDGTDPLNPVYAWSGDTLYQTDSFSILLYVELAMVGASDSASWTNYSEIGYARDTSGMEWDDIDSEADGDPLNDTGGTPNSDEDDHVADDGVDTDQDGITDEDDHDPLYVPVYDLALQKRINNAFPGPYRYGDTITL
ncbi:DUF11 domain-containing protein, partial [Membranihabitans maritimus]|uniref:DUF11 domain-containing protein n=1 Tax=Membranihabitans maritimus TaxID=2904244 RepID=UPI001F3CC972